MISRIFLASKNSGKISEANEILQRFNIVAEGAGEEILFPEEIGSTFQENAEAKARYLSQFVSGVLIGEDSGLVVPVLNGAPGIHSARFAGIDATDSQNIEKLLYYMADKKADQRGAYFISVAALLERDGSVSFFEGRMYGEISLSQRGENGFGYDPIFEIPLLGKTVAELTSLEKNRISHRGQVFEKIGKYLTMAV
jgi:XTP/dITP diphosphohydrolase